MPRLVIICGAGSTLSDAQGRPVKDRPPLDRGFFKAAKRNGNREYTAVASYLQTNYSIDPSSTEADSLEGVMAILYSDIYNPVSSRNAATAAFRSLLRLLNRRIAETTNSMSPGQRGYVYRLVRQKLLDGYSPGDITLMTFNYDLHIERTLWALQSSTTMNPYRPILRFPNCYGLTGFKLSSAPQHESKFTVNRNATGRVEILKLHGSLNWFSQHNSKDPGPNALLNPKRDLWITPRRKVLVDMKITSTQRRMYTFPIVVPPVIHKASILHERLKPVWSRAFDVLKTASELIVFGYSCPVADQESANLITRGLRNNASLKAITVIDPSVAAFDRFADLSGMPAVHYFRNCNAFLQST